VHICACMWTHAVLLLSLALVLPRANVREGAADRDLCKGVLLIETTARERAVDKDSRPALTQVTYMTHNMTHTGLCREKNKSVHYTLQRRSVHFTLQRQAPYITEKEGGLEAETAASAGRGADRDRRHTGHTGVRVSGHTLYAHLSL